jgi:hypothetical protein
VARVPLLGYERRDAGFDPHPSDYVLVCVDGSGLACALSGSGILSSQREIGFQAIVRFRLK